MKRISTCFIVALAGLVLADTKFETYRGISTTSHEVSPLPVRSQQTLLDGREPNKDEQSRTQDTYRLSWTTMLPDHRQVGDGSSPAMFTLRVWDPVDKHFPGWNSPIVEIFSGDKRLSCQRLSEVGWAVDVWSASHEGEFLYVKTKHRHRFAEGDNIYELNPESLKLEHRGVHFAKEELIREDKRLRNALEILSKQHGEQTGAVPPATRPESNSDGGDKPSPEAEGRSR